MGRAVRMALEASQCWRTWGRRRRAVVHTRGGRMAARLSARLKISERVPQCSTSARRHHVNNPTPSPPIPPPSLLPPLPPRHPLPYLYEPPPPHRLPPPRHPRIPPQLPSPTPTPPSNPSSSTETSSSPYTLPPSSSPTSSSPPPLPCESQPATSSTFAGSPLPFRTNPLHPIPPHLLHTTILLLARPPTKRLTDHLHNALRISFLEYLPAVLAWDREDEGPPLFGRVADTYSMRRLWGGGCFSIGVEIRCRSRGCYRDRRALAGRGGR